MHPAHAQLSSLSTTLDDLVARVTATADALLAEGHETEAADLFEVERALRSGAARLTTAVRRLA